MPREGTDHRSSRKGSKEYILLVQGLPSDCTWQNFKDGIRNMGFDHIRGSHIFVTNDGEVIGFITITDKTHAFRAYDIVAHDGWYGRTVSVGLIKQTGPDTHERVTPLAQSPRRSPPSTHGQVYQYSQQGSSSNASSASPNVSPRHFQPSGYGHFNQPMLASYQNCAPGFQTDPRINATPAMIQMAREWFGFALAPVLAPAYNRHAVLSTHMANAQATTAPIVYNTAAYTVPHSLAQTTTRYASSPGIGVSSATITNLSRNQPQLTLTYNTRPLPALQYQQNGHLQHQQPISAIPHENAAVVPSNRSVFLTGLSWELSEYGLKKLLKRYGTVERCDMQWDDRKNRRKGAATARFRTHEEAANCIKAMDGRMLGSTPREVACRWDKEGSEGVIVREGAGAGVKRTQERDGRRDGHGGGRERERERNRQRAQRSSSYEGPVIVNGARGSYSVTSGSGRRSDSSSDSESEDEGVRHVASRSRSDRHSAR